MIWRIAVTFEAEKDLEWLDASVRKRVLEKLAWLRHNFDFIIPLPLGGKWICVIKNSFMGLGAMWKLYLYLT